ncbi:uncharacterized protein LOC143535553 [Bidens hawaiensis]|uniref:uncharacterized protein LOC143535553 n=1 Tax=Bidens hawaiensis TaxID=980011 RepID=UPI0040498CD8
MTSNNRTYHGWSSDEDAKLVEALINMVNMGGFRSDNGFRSGYLQHLEASLKESLPGSGILGKPHIESRIKTMKRDWQVVYDMLKTSGFGYNKELNCVTTNAPGVWESYIESHRNASKWQNKRLPHYEELCVIFGKDQAEGNKAKSAVEMEQEVNVEEQESRGDDDLDEHNHNDGSNSSFQVEETSSGCTKKRIRMKQSHDFLDAVNLFADRLKETSSALSAKMSEDIKFELDLKKKTMMLPSELSKMTSLTQLDRFRAVEKIKGDNVMTFWSLDEEEREAWVRFLLSG